MTAQNGLYKADTTIASSGTTSDPVASSGGVLAGIYAPAMTGASLSFTVANADDPTNFVPVRDQFGSLVTVTLNAAASYYSLRGILPFGADFVRVVSASSEASARTLKLVFQAVI